MLFSERTQGFLTWLTDNDVLLSPKIEICDLRSAGQGRSVLATDSVGEDEELFSIPRSAILNVDTCALVQDKSAAKPVLEDMTQWEALVLVFLYEWKVKAHDLRWTAYFDVLPVNDPSYSSDQLIYWEKSELAALSPSYIVERVGHDQATAMYEKLAPRFEEFIGPVTPEDFRLVASVIMAYSFDVDNHENEDEADPALMDLMAADEPEGDEAKEPVEGSQEVHNHGNGHNHDHSHDHGLSENELDGEAEEESEQNEELVKNSDLLKSMVPLADTLNADTTKHNASLFVTADRLVMRSIKPIAKGDQIYNIYSEHPNAEILRRYGYVEQQGSKHDFAEVSLATFKKYFAENSSLSKDTIDEVVDILEEIEAEEEEKFVLESYDCFASGEVIFELTFLTQLFVIIAAINHKKSFNSASSEVKARAVRRVYKKTYQLLEARKLTAQFMKDFPKILKVRLSDYPSKATRGFAQTSSPMKRLEMAMTVLASECLSLQNCMDTNKVFMQGENKFSVIDDEKLLRNIMKKDTFEGTETQPNKKSRLS